MNSAVTHSSRRLMLALAGLLTATLGHAADPYPQPQPYPQQGYPQSYPEQRFQQPAEAHPMRAMFANSLAQVAQTTGNTAVMMLADGLTGSLKNWFDARRQHKQRGANGNAMQTMSSTPSYPTSSYPTSSYPQPGDPQSGYPQSGDPQSGYPQTGYSQPGYPATDTTGYPTPNGTDNTGYPPQGADPNGYPNPTTDAYPTNGYPTPTTAPAPPQLYAGIAYEIHKLQPDGTTLAVDPATYSFHTGEQFRVYYRPSLPGRVDVFNINAAGQQSQIDSNVIAAGELATLGPYEFALMQGQETLILKLTPCTTPTTYAATRNIIKAQGPPTAMPTSDASGFGFNDCSSTATRGLRTKTRDIRKVSNEGGTSFALDPIGANELGGGDMAPRQVTISLMHR